MKAIPLLSLALFTSLLLVACGGSGGGSKTPSSSASSTSSSTSTESSSSSSESSSSSSESSSSSSESSNASSLSSSSFSSELSCPQGNSWPDCPTHTWSDEYCAMHPSICIRSSSSSQSSTPVSYSLGGNVTGLDGNLKLQAGGQTLEIAENGSFNFPNEIQEGTPITLSLSETPFRQSCTIESANQFTLESDISNISVSCAPLGILTGNVSSYHTGTPINQAQITVTALTAEGESLMTASAQTDETGTFRIEGLGIAERFVLNAWGEGFATRSEVFSNSAEQPNVDRSALVLEANYSTDFSASSAASLVVDGQTLVELPANAFVTTNGSAASGTITPSLTIIDPSGDAGVMPGNYEVRDPETGAINLMESFGALDASFRDAAGNLLQLAPGTSATISIPLASRINEGTAPATVPLFYFDEASGYWIEEGEATLVEVDGQYFYRGTVTHFTTWNADRIYETVNLRGCVRDADNNPLANVRIVASGRDYIGQSTGYSDDTGAFVLPVRMNSSILLTSISGSQSDTVNVFSTGTDTLIETCLQLAESSATITLTWGENPDDLDSHWFIPNIEGDLEYQVYFGNKTEEVNGVVFDLDVDDVTSFGPEVVTVPDFPHAGTYRYVVRLYSGTGTIADSPARVELNLRGNISVFSPSEASGDHSEEFWHVFNIQVDAEGNTSVETVQEFTDSRYPAEAVLTASTRRSFKTGSAPASPTKQEPALKETKHYTK